MPCCGPNLDWYAEKSRDAFEEIMTLLVNKYRIDGSILFKDAQERYEEDKKKLAAVLEEMFVNQGCADF